MDRILQMFLNRVLGRLMNKAIDGGINYVSRGKEPQVLTPEQAAQSREAKQLAQKAKKMQRMGRKLF